MTSNANDIQVGNTGNLGCRTITFGFNIIPTLTWNLTVMVAACTSLTNPVWIPGIATNIGNYAFFECYSLSSVTDSQRRHQPRKPCVEDCYDLTECDNSRQRNQLGEYGTFESYHQSDQRSLLPTVSPPSGMEAFLTAAA